MLTSGAAFIMMSLSTAFAQTEDSDQAGLDVAGDFTAVEDQNAVEDNAVEDNAVEDLDSAGQRSPVLPEPASPTGDAAGQPRGAADPRFAQMVKEAEAIQAKIERLAEDVSHMLREARNASDIVQQMCLDDKLNQIDVAGQTAETSVAGMKAAADAGDGGEVQRSYSVMQALAESSAELSGEANQCIGEQKKFIAGASLNVTVDPEIPRSDTTGGELAVPPTAVPNTVEIQDPPPSVSPVM